MEKQSLFDLIPLPYENWRKLGEALYLPPQTQRALIRFPMYRFLYGCRGDTTGLMMLIGDPGTGKSDSVRWAADAVMRRFGTKGNALVINPAGLQDEHLGRSQKNVAELIEKIAFSASQVPTAVILDDAEAVLMSRKQSTQSNDPTDVAKATTTLLHGLDRLRFNPNIVQFATLNISGLVDEAILSRCDVIIPFNLPNVQARTAILTRNLKGLAGERVLGKLVAATEGKSGRDLNKINLLAYLQGTGTSLNDLTESDYLAACRCLHTQLQTSEGKHHA
jgi:AAA+ superfamily predicted ATPase